MTKLRVFYDGACPMCQKEIAVYRRADTAGAIDWLDVSMDTSGEVLPLPRELLLARFHVQTPIGELISGARGFIALWREVPGWRGLARVCSLPGVPFILELGYKLFLRIRPRIQRWIKPKG